MRKVYEKPWIYMEQLELSEHIAACDWDYNNNTEATSCFAEGELDGYTGTVKIFLEGVTNCALTDDYCNYTASDKSVTFNS